MLTDTDHTDSIFQTQHTLSTENTEDILTVAIVHYSHKHIQQNI